MGEQPDLLDDVADAAAQLHRVGVGDVHAVEVDPPGRRLDQPVDHLQRGRLAAARRTHQADQCAARDVEVELVRPPPCRRGRSCPRPRAGSCRLRSCRARYGLAVTPAATPPENCLTRNDWICGEYITTRADDLGEALRPAPRHRRRLGAARAGAAFPLALSPDATEGSTAW